MGQGEVLVEVEVLARPLCPLPATPVRRLGRRSPNQLPFQAEATVLRISQAPAPWLRIRPSLNKTPSTRTTANLDSRGKAAPSTPTLFDAELRLDVQAERAVILPEGEMRHRRTVNGVRASTLNGVKLVPHAASDRVRHCWRPKTDGPGQCIPSRRAICSTSGLASKAQGSLRPTPERCLATHALPRSPQDRTRTKTLRNKRGHRTEAHRDTAHLNGTAATPLSRGNVTRRSRSIRRSKAVILLNVVDATCVIPLATGGLRDQPRHSPIVKHEGPAPPAPHRPLDRDGKVVATVLRGVLHTIVLDPRPQAPTRHRAVAPVRGPLTRQIAL